MPQPATGARLFPISISQPASLGLNTEMGGNILPPQWATTLDNAVFDESGRPASRKGWLSLTTSAGSSIVKRIFEYYKADGTSDVIFSTDDDIYNNTTTATSIDGTLTISDGNIKFVNFNDKVVAFGIGTSSIPAVKTTGNFADITVNSGTAPDGTIGTSAFGRLWVANADGKTLKYSALLDETRWDAADGGGSIDFSKIWPAGQDNIVAVEELGGRLIVFGSNNTVLLTDNANTALGLDPTAIYVSDTIPGSGAVSQFGIARVAGDLLVLTRSGLISLQREVVQKSTPLTNLTKNIQSAIVNAIANEASVDDITMDYNPKESIVVMCFPASNQQFTLDTRNPLEDGSFRATSWTSDLQTLAYIRASQDFYGSLTGVVGEVMQYTGADDDGSTFAFDYESGWIDMGDELNAFLKLIKRITSFIFIEQNVVVSYKIDYDFGLKEFVIQNSATGGRVAEYNTAEYGANGVYDVNDADAVAGTDVAEYAGSVQLRTLDVNGKGSGQYVRIGLRLDTNSGDFALQQINLYAKVGRTAS